ncbi:MAG: SLOG family protein [Oscillospiraceae bacterium]|nr:SLOG family protein [Oscillospiraceae bacterium]
MKAVELRKKTCCFTGHRDIPIGRAQEIAERTANEIRKLIVNHGVCFFGVGGAIGYDMLAAKVLFRLRETEFPDIKVILVYPFDGFTDRWSPTQIADHQRLLPKYDKVVCVCDRPSREAYLKRNRHLVDGSAYCIAYCTRDYGGTAYTVRYARHQGLEIRNIDF